MSTPANSPTLSLRREGAIGALVINRPVARNAITNQMWRTIPRLLGQAANDKALRVLIVHGGNGGVFSAGADIAQLGQIAGDADKAARFMGQMGAAISALAKFPKPVIARIDGPCIGAGIALALACDVRFAAASARFGITPAKLGITYPLSDTRRLVSIIGPAYAKDLLFSARLVEAKEALAMGLITHISADHDLAEFTHERAAQMAQRSAHTQRAMKRMIDSLCVDDLALAAQAQAIFTQSFCEGDFKEGFAAFTEKRKPSF